MKKEKIKIGIFSFTSCEGCELTILERPEQFLNLLGQAELVNSRLLKEKNHEELSEGLSYGFCGHYVHHRL